MFSLLYDFVLFLIGLFALPMLLWHAIWHGKYRKSLKQRLGFKLPKFEKKKFVIWIHTISMGETRAAIPLYNLLRKAYPDASFVLSTTTETGQAEALRSMPTADAHFFLPLDFSFTMRRLVKKIQPNLLVTVESDFWYHMLKYSKEAGAAIVLVNGKMSEHSHKRFSKFRSFNKRLFSLFDCLCLQSQRFYQLFITLNIDPKKLVVTGNLKFDAPLPKMSAEEINTWKSDLGFSAHDRILTIGSTHDPEEQELLAALDTVWKTIPNLKVILVPRHPERFEAVSKLLEARAIPFVSYTQRAAKTGQERVVLMDTMGLLRHCYQLAEIAIVAGSFTDRVGGHNIMEPVQLNVPVLFGPHMHTQLDMVEDVLRAKTGLQVTVSELPKTLIHLFGSQAELAQMRQACTHLSDEMQGAAVRTFKTIQDVLKKIEV
jgi:3-deoxy-D-manno-octulosonic-acid transferase